MSLTQHTVEEQRIQDWRFNFARNLGYSVNMANYIAETPGIDIHELEDLINRSCTLTLALNIVT